jgi:hypothetical protein
VLTTHPSRKKGKKNLKKNEKKVKKTTHPSRPYMLL